MTLLQPLRPVLARSASLPPCTCIVLSRSLATPAMTRSLTADGDAKGKQAARSQASGFLSHDQKRWFAYHAMPMDYEPNELEEDTGPVVQEVSHSRQPHPTSHQTDDAFLSPPEPADPDDASFPHPIRPRASRTQVERTKMSARERAIAHQLLEDFPSIRDKAGLEDFRLEPGRVSLNGPHSNDGADFFAQTFGDVEAARRESMRAAREKRREEDLVREMMDGLVAEMDSVGTDVELVRWMNERVFGLSADSAQPSTFEPSRRSYSTIGEAFSAEWDPAQTNDTVPLSTLRSSFPSSDPIPLHRTVLYPNILIHLMRRFRDTFHNPHLALHVFSLSRRLSRPSTYARTFTPSLYAELFRTRWQHLGDVEGVRAGLDEMLALGGEVDREVRKSLEGIAKVVVVQDGIRAEAQAERDLREAAKREGLPEDAHGRGLRVTREMVEQRRRYTPAERRAAEEIEALVAKSWEQEEQRLSAPGGRSKRSMAWADAASHRGLLTRSAYAAPFSTSSRPQYWSTQE